MVARTVSRSRLVGLTRNSAVFHALAGSANEDAEQYFQMARLRELFSIDRATGSDLDERAAEIVPNIIVRRGALHASGTVVFSRPGTTGTITIPLGTQIAASDADGDIRFRTTSAGEIPAASSVSGAIDVIATEAGIRGNVGAADIIKLITRIPGVTGVTNAAKYANGADRESDQNFRARLKAFVQAISRGTVTAQEAFARNVILADGRRVLFAKVVEPIIPTGQIDLYIDDGTGSIEEFSSEFIAGADTFLPSALGGEINLFTTSRPIRDDGSFVLEVDTLLDAPSSGAGFVALVRGTDYELNAAKGQIELLSGGAVPAMLVGYGARANYRYYTGLIQETQRIIDGDPATPTTRPGVRAGGTQTFVKAPGTVFQTVTASISVLADFDPTLVATEVAGVIQDYVNTLDIGGDVIVSEIIERSMGTDGMFDITITTPSANQVILDSQVARIVAASITLT
jgi:uncharacterized phage protein gp47/JayE